VAICAPIEIAALAIPRRNTQFLGERHEGIGRYEAS
jgi:hypothetical protein